MAPRTVAIVQARVGSTRLPGKVLLPLADRPLLLHVLARLARARSLDQVVLAIPDRREDEPLLGLAAQAGVLAVQGPEQDVLTRYLLAARQAQAETVVRVTSDCPLIDPATVDRVVDEFHRRGDLDYLSASSASGFPRGLDTEVFSCAALARAGELATEPSAREHVTLFLYRHPELFRVDQLQAPQQLRHPELRLCVDEPADLALMGEIYRRLAREGEIVDLQQALALLQAEPELARTNATVRQKSV